MFQFPACPPARLCVHLAVLPSSDSGFPHSDIHGSKPACGSPWLFAACHVLRRRMVPGHPPCALCSLIFSSLFPETNCSDLYPNLSIRFHILFLTSDLPFRGCQLQLAFFLNLLYAVVKVRSLSSFRMSVGRSGLEPPTSRLSGECSNRLS